MKKIFLSLVFLILGYSAWAQSFEIKPYVIQGKKASENYQWTSYMIDGDISTYAQTRSEVDFSAAEFDVFFRSNVLSLNKIVYTPKQRGAGSTNTAGLAGNWLKVDVLYSTQANPTVFQTAISNVVWANTTQPKTIDFPQEIARPAYIRLVVKETHEQKIFTGAELQFFSNKDVENLYTESPKCTIDASQVIFSFDTKVQALVSGSTASEDNGSAYSIAKSFDNDQSTRYSSRWSGRTVLPIKLNYRFDGTSAIDYLVNYPPSNTNNGSIGKGELWYNTSSNATKVKLMDFDLNKSRTPSRLNFPNSITPLNIELIINSGFSDEVAISEMEFFKSMPINSTFEYNTIFEDILANKLKPNVTLANINAIQSKFYKSLAKCLYDKTYNLKRSKSHTVFPIIGDIHTELKVNGRNNVENATGIYANKGDTIVVLVKGIPVGINDVSIKVWNQETGINSGPFSSRLLVNGFNSFVAPNNGLLYINYYNNNLNLNDIEVNIVTGKYNGAYFLNETSNNEWLKMLDNDHSPMIDLVGENTQILASKYALKQAGVLDPKPLLEYYDLINKNEFLLSGFYKYNRLHKNRMFNYIHGTDGYWMATANGISLHHAAGAEKSLVIPQMSLWGVAHEFGHSNQVRPHLNFAGYNEASNNVFSSFIVQTLGTDSYRRLTALEVDATSYSNTDDASDPLNGVPSKVGGFINIALNRTIVHNKNIFDLNESNGMMYNLNFSTVVPLHSLMTYYVLAGAAKGAPLLKLENIGGTTHSDGVDYANMWGEVNEKFRLLPMPTTLTPGENLMYLVKFACDAVKEDLTDFFSKASILKVQDLGISAYPNRMKITQEMVNEVKTYVLNKGYKKPVSPVINYVNAHNKSFYLNRSKVQGSAGVGFTLKTSGNFNYLVSDTNSWKNVVAYEATDQDNKILYITGAGTGDVSNRTTEVYMPTGTQKVFAVGYDGERRLMYPNVESKVEINIIKE